MTFEKKILMSDIWRGHMEKNCTPIGGSTKNDAMACDVIQLMIYENSDHEGVCQNILALGRGRRKILVMVGGSMKEMIFGYFHPYPRLEYLSSEEIF